MSRVGITGTQVAIAALQSRVDNALAYPHPGVPCGPGIHEPGGGVTVTAATPVQNPHTSVLWALPVTEEVRSQLTGPERAQAGPLDSSWDSP